MQSSAEPYACYCHHESQTTLFIMFYQLTLTKTMDVHPRHFGKNLSEIIGARLIEEVRLIRKFPTIQWHLCVCICIDGACAPPQNTNALVHTMHTQVEGTCHGKYGYVIAVTNMVSKGQVSRHSKELWTVRDHH